MKGEHPYGSIRTKAMPRTGAKLAKKHHALLVGLTAEQAAARSGMSTRAARRLLKRLGK